MKCQNKVKHSRIAKFVTIGYERKKDCPLGMVTSVPLSAEDCVVCKERKQQGRRATADLLELESR